MKKSTWILLLCVCTCSVTFGQRKEKKQKKEPVASSEFDAKKFAAMQWRNIGPFRGGRSVACSGVIGDPLTYYMGSVGGGIWKTTDAGTTWKNISDGFLKTGTVGAIAVSNSDANVIYVGMGEHAVRGVMCSRGDGMYKSTDAGATWHHVGLPESHHIAEIRIHPTNPEVLWVAVQGQLYGPSEDRGVYKSMDGGSTWKKVLYVNPNTGASDLSLDPTNPRILYASMWDHQRTPWQVRSGAGEEGSGIWKSLDGGETWKQLEGGLPKKMGKSAVDVSAANPNVVYANIECEKGGVYKSTDAGKTWQRTCGDRITITRAWYYIEIFADPQDENKVYVLNAPMLRSIDGGRSFRRVSNPHSDQHHMWINPDNPSNIILSNDGGACVTFNGGASWSTQNNQPTAQFYRVIADDQFPYHLYAGQQDNSTVAIASQTAGAGIGMRDWYPVAGGESAFITFNDPSNPTKIYGTSIQGFIDVWDAKTKQRKDIQPYPQAKLGTDPREQKYRFNWNPPIVSSKFDPSIMYFGGNVLFRSADGGISWTEISDDLTRNDTSKHGPGGYPFTNEGAGGEVYNNISYITTSTHSAGEIWVGTDCGLVQMTTDEGANWKNVTPNGLAESLINAIEVSPTKAGRVMIAVTRYKFNDERPMVYISDDYGASWSLKVNGIPEDNFVRVVRQDPINENLLYAGTERGLYISFNSGDLWEPFQSNLPVCPVTDLIIKENDLIASTSGRAFWILDDLGPLQQTAGTPDTMALTLLDPSETTKLTLSAGNRPLIGKNPMPGVMLSYYLPHTWEDTSNLVLEVMDQSGNIIRTLTNVKDPNFKKWEGGPPPAQVIPAKAGLNRTYWDMRKAALPAVENVFVFGDYRGSTVPPGTYKLRITTEDSLVAETQCVIKADPRIEADEETYAEQQRLLGQVEFTANDIHESVNRLKKVKSQLASMIGILEETDGVEELVEQGKTVEKAITEWENNLIQPESKTFQDVINFKNKLNSELLIIKGVLDNLDPKPTAGARLRLAETTKEWTMMKTEMNRLIDEEVGGFNAMYEEKNLPALIVPEAKKGTKP